MKRKKQDKVDKIMAEHELNKVALRGDRMALKTQKVREMIQKAREMIVIDMKRFAFDKIGKGKKWHIFPKNYQFKALCLRGPRVGLQGCGDLDVCKECQKEYPIVSRSVIFKELIG